MRIISLISVKFDSKTLEQGLNRRLGLNASYNDGRPAPIQYSFLVYDSFVGEDHLDTPIAGLRDRDIKVGGDGTFTISVDSSPTDGRANHIQTSANARVLLVRNTFREWQRQTPLEVSVKRLSAPIQDAPTDREVAHRAGLSTQGRH